MPDKRKHRGPAPGDERIFGESFVPDLRLAVRDLSWLLSRGYAEKSALKLVGDRYHLTTRQRQAVNRAACADADLAERLRKQCERRDLARSTLIIDGYNVLTSIEAALAGGALFIGRDGCLRDVASMHGSFRKVEETEPAINRIAESIQQLDVHRAAWYFDQPVSNSGRLKMMLLEIGESKNLDWTVELVPDPDRVLIDSTGDSRIICTADSVILDAPNVRWFNLARFVIDHHVARSWVIDLRLDAG